MGPDTICDICGKVTPEEDISTPMAGEWEGASLCPDCFTAEDGARDIDDD